MAPDKRFAKKLAAVIHDKMGVDIVLMDVRRKSDYCNHFLVVSGKNRMHLSALYDRVKEYVKDLDIKVYGEDGRPESGWIILDFGPLIVHIFSPEMREFYNIQGIWENPKYVDLELD